MSPDPPEPVRNTGPMRIVLSNYPSRAAALAAVDAVLARRLAACANVLPVESRYWWKRRVESASESMVLFKTVLKHVEELLRFLKESHPYDVPEVVELDVLRVDPEYFGYLAATVGSAAAPPPGRGPTRRRARPQARAVRGPGRTRERHRRRSR
jgi:periplasmic divalent cation tolerance protein